MSEFKPDFSHRLSENLMVNGQVTFDGLVDTIYLLCERATAKLEMVADKYDQTIPSERLAAVSVNAALLDICDIEAVVLAYRVHN